MYLNNGDKMKTKSKRIKKYFILIITILSIYLTYNYLERKNIEITDKDIVDLVINNSFKEENIVKRIINQNTVNPIKLLNKSYESVVENESHNEPIIYIYNSHPTEEYQSTTLGEYSINPTVIMNNYILEDIFNKRGYQTYVEENSVKDILDKNNWNYASSYRASRELLESAKINNPSLKYFIDIHRDSLSKEKTSISIDGKDYAKIIFLLGLENPNYKENNEFIEKINNKVNNYYPGLSKGIYKKEGPGVNGVYNEDFSNRLILVEIGGHENTTSEVLNTAIAFSKCYLEVLDEENS